MCVGGCVITTKAKNNIFYRFFFTPLTPLGLIHSKNFKTYCNIKMRLPKIELFCEFQSTVAILRKNSFHSIYKGMKKMVHNARHSTIISENSKHIYQKYVKETLGLLYFLVFLFIYHVVSWLSSALNDLTHIFQNSKIIITSHQINIPIK